MKGGCRKGKTVKGIKYLLCIAAGVVFYLAAGLASGDEMDLDAFYLKRNPCGQGEAGYHFIVEGLEKESVPIELSLEEQKLTETQGEKILRQAAELLSERIRGENLSLSEVRTDLNFPDEIPEYGLTVNWKSDRPEIVSSMGTVRGEEALKGGEAVSLTAELANGIFSRTVEIPVTVFPPEEGIRERFLRKLEAEALSAQTEGGIELPRKFEGETLTYRSTEQSGNEILLALGAAAAGCLYLKEKSDAKKRREKRDAELVRDYSEVISRFVVLTGAGYTIRQAWKKMVVDYEKSAGRRGGRKKPAYEEMHTALNQMETGIPEPQAYGNFGRSCGLRCYIRLSSLLTNSLNTGGKNLRNLLEEEVKTAFEQRKDLAKRLGEEASTKLLIPLFLMLGVVMVMIVAPAFLTLG